MKLERLRFITSNPGKVTEFQARLEPLNIKVEPLRLDYPEIQADTLEEVVEYGLAHLGDQWQAGENHFHGTPPGLEGSFGADLRTGVGADLLGLEIPPGTALAIDDSGLFVEALGGYPGVYSKALFMAAGPQGLLRLMEPHQDRREAEFRTVIGLRLPNQETKLFDGRCRGLLGLERRGENGFGFDPLFIPHDQPETPCSDLRTFAEMTREEKNEVSHRGRALEALVKWLGNGRTPEP